MSALGAACVFTGATDSAKAKLAMQKSKNVRKKLFRWIPKSNYKKASTCPLNMGSTGFYLVCLCPSIAAATRQFR